MNIKLPYTSLDKKIDKYLNTNNLRPGPPARLVSRLLNPDEQKSYSNLSNINPYTFSFVPSKLIPWQNLTSIKIGDYGGETAFFLEFLENKQLVLKANPDVPLYFFGNMMAKAYGIVSPSCRLIEYNDPEFADMINNLQRASINDKLIHNKIINLMRDFPFMLLYEYIPNISIFELGQNRANILLNEGNFKSRDIMMSIGKIICFDMLINDNNRIPFVWLNNGNPNNIILSVVIEMLQPNTRFKNENVIEIFLDNVVALDTCPNILNPENGCDAQQLGEYINQITESLKLVAFELKNIIIYGKELSTTDFRSFEKLTLMIKNSTGYDLTPKNKYDVALGLFIMMNQITEYGIDPINALIKYVRNEAISNDWANIYVQSANKINSDYFKHILDLFNKIKDDNDQIFDWINNNTFHIYEINVYDQANAVIKKQSELKYSKQILNEDEDNQDPKKKKKKKKKGDDIIEVKPEKVTDFFNYNPNDKLPFINDVHNGFYEIFNFSNDLAFELKNRKYNKLINKPPEPKDIEDEPEIELPPIQRLEVEKLGFRDKHTVLSMEALTNKLKKEEYYDNIMLKRKDNPSEAQKMEEMANLADNDFLDFETKKRKQEIENRKKLENENIIRMNNIEKKQLEFNEI